MNFPLGLTSEEKKRTISTLHKILKYLDLDNIFLVGGLVARYYIIKAGLAYKEERKLNDIDIVFNTPESINPKLTSEFKIDHYHKTENNMYLSIVCPINKIKIDVFDGRHRPVLEFQSIEFDGMPLRIPTLEDQFAEYARDCYRPVFLKGFKNKMHYYTDTKLLRQIVDMKNAQRIYDRMNNEDYPYSAAWRDKKIAELPESIDEVYESAMEFAKEHPERIIATGYSEAKGPVECSYCAKDDPDFPLTPQKEIFEIMGWSN